MYVTDNATGKIIICSHCHPTLRLYEITLHWNPQKLPRVSPTTLPRVPPYTVSSAYEIQLVQLIINFLHLSCLLAPIYVWIKAITHVYFATWLGSTVDRIQKYYTKKINTAKLQIHLTPSNVWSTCICTKPRSNSHHVETFVLSKDEMKYLIAMDFSGQYPHTSKHANKYIFILYDYNSNYIDAITIKFRKTSEYIRTFQEYYDNSKCRSFTAKLLCLDN